MGLVYLQVFFFFIGACLLLQKSILIQNSHMLNLHYHTCQQLSLSFFTLNHLKKILGRSFQSSYILQTFYLF